MLVSLSINEVKILREALNYAKRPDLNELLENNKHNKFELTDDQLIDMDDCCQDYFLFTGLNENYESTLKGKLIEQLIDKFYSYLKS